MTNVVTSRRARSTGTRVSVIDNRDGSFDTGDLPWFTLCEQHGGVCSHPTRKLAESWAADPETWCQKCQQKDPGREERRTGMTSPECPATGRSATACDSPDHRNCGPAVMRPAPPAPKRGAGPVGCCGGHRARCVFGHMHSWSTWYEDGRLQRTRDTYHCHVCGGVCTADESTDVTGVHRGMSAMTATQAPRSAGQELTATLRRYFSVGTRTRRYRTGRYGCRQDLHAEMIEALHFAATQPGYYSQATEKALRPGFGAALAYGKHVDGYRIDGTLRFAITGMSPWRFAELLGQMVDAGVTCTGDGERFFADMARAMRAAAAAGVPR